MKDRFKTALLFAVVLISLCVFYPAVSAAESCLYGCPVNSTICNDNCGNNCTSENTGYSDVTWQCFEGNRLEAMNPCSGSGATRVPRCINSFACVCLGCTCPDPSVITCGQAIPASAGCSNNCGSGTYCGSGTACSGGSCIGCTCGAWQNESCTPDNKRQQTRACNPGGCLAESQLVADTTCNDNFGIPLRNMLTVSSIEDFLSKIASFIFWVGMTLAPIIFVIAGFIYVTSAGSPQKVETAKRMMLYAVIGLVVILIAKGLVLVLKLMLGVR